MWRTVSHFPDSNKPTRKIPAAHLLEICKVFLYKSQEVSKVSASYITPFLHLKIKQRKKPILKRWKKYLSDIFKNPLLWPVGPSPGRDIPVSVPSMSVILQTAKAAINNPFSFKTTLRICMLVFTEGSKIHAIAGLSRPALPVWWSSLTGTCDQDLRVFPYAAQWTAWCEPQNYASNWSDRGKHDSPSCNLHDEFWPLLRHMQQPAEAHNQTGQRLRESRPLVH